MTGECSVDILTTLFIKKDRQEKQIYDERKKGKEEILINSTRSGREEIEKINQIEFRNIS